MHHRPQQLKQLMALPPRLLPLPQQLKPQQLEPLDHHKLSLPLALAEALMAVAMPPRLAVRLALVAVALLSLKPSLAFLFLPPFL
jgi:hypothetical protein